MKSSVRWLFALLLVASWSDRFMLEEMRTLLPTTSHRPELEYFKAVNRAGPPRDPQLLFLLMGQYANANMHREGIEFFSTLVKEFEPRLSDRQKSLYLGAIGLLRAGHASEVPFLKQNRMGQGNHRDLGGGQTVIGRTNLCRPMDIRGGLCATSRLLQSEGSGVS